MEEKEKREKKTRGNGFFHFKSHFVQSQMTVFKDALSRSSGFWTAVPSLMVRYRSPSLAPICPYLFIPPPCRQPGAFVWRHHAGFRMCGSEGGGDFEL